MDSEIPNFIVWLKMDLTYRIYEYKSKTLTTSTKLPDQKTINQFEYRPKTADEKTDENLIKYLDDLIEWRNEIKDEFDYFDNNFSIKGEIFYRTHSNNIKTFLKRFMSDIYKDFEPIEIKEEVMFLKTNRGGVCYGNKGIYDVWTYDYKFFYPLIMSLKDYHIPRTKGEIKKINEIPKLFDFGIYNIKVISLDDNFNKVFTFSKTNYYTHYSLNFVLYYNEVYKGLIELKLISNEALIYKKNCLCSGHGIFYKWYKKLLDLRTRFPKNKLLKGFGSTAWGELQSYHVLIKTEKEIEKENLNISFDFDEDFYIKDECIKADEDIYYLVDLRKNIYQYQLRMKSFISDYGRVKIAKIALKNIDDVVRIQTDSITYKKDIKINIKNFVLDNDKTGKFEILNNRSMKKVE